MAAPAAAETFPPAEAVEFEEAIAIPPLDFAELGRAEAAATAACCWFKGKIKVGPY